MTPVAEETMVRRCPKCGRRFPGEYVYCPDDAFELTTDASKSKSVRPYTRPLAIIGIFALAATVTLAGLRHGVRGAIPIKGAQARLLAERQQGAPARLAGQPSTSATRSGSAGAEVLTVQHQSAVPANTTGAAPRIGSADGRMPVRTIKSNAPVAPSSVYIDPDISAEHLLTPDDLAGLSGWELRLERNAIYARHGYIFHSPDLREYFARQAWYRPVTSDQDAVVKSFSAVERENVLLLRQREAAVAPHAGRW
ncbi:MAG: YARHG domain-containing protein [Patescibacteria group bacterium]|nr:YARHG domain-containing protein [Patescibacteria group bacterium]